MEKVKGKCIAFVGPFGDTNFGDYAMMVNDVLDISAEKTILFTYNEDFTNALVQKYMANLDVEVFETKSKLEDTVAVTGKSYSIQYNSLSESSSDVISSVYEHDIRKKLENVDTLVVTGGGFLNFLWCTPHRKKRLFTILAPILIADEMNIPVVFMGNTYGPWENCYDFFSAFFESMKNAKFCTRDKESAMQFNEINKNADVTLLPDDLYFINSEILSTNVSLNLPEKYVVIESYATLQQLEDTVGIIKDTVDYFWNEYGLKTVFLPFDGNFGGVKQGDLLKEQIPDLIVLPFDTYLPIELCDCIMKNAEFVMCNRYHAFLMAVRNRVPCYMYIRTINGDTDYYINKINGILELFGDLTEDERKLFYEIDFVSYIKNGVLLAKKAEEQRKLFGRMGKVEEEWKKARQKHISSLTK